MAVKHKVANHDLGYRIGTAVERVINRLYRRVTLRIDTAVARKRLAKTPREDWVPLDRARAASKLKGR